MQRPEIRAPDAWGAPAVQGLPDQGTKHTSEEGFVTTSLGHHLIAVT